VNSEKEKNSRKTPGKGGRHKVHGGNYKGAGKGRSNGSYCAMSENNPRRKRKRAGQLAPSAPAKTARRRCSANSTQKKRDPKHEKKWTQGEGGKEREGKKLGAGNLRENQPTGKKRVFAYTSYTRHGLTAKKTCERKRLQGKSPAEGRGKEEGGVRKKKDDD